MSSSYLLDPFIINLMAEKGKSYLDIGCGLGKWGYLIQTSHKPSSFMVGGDLDIEAIKYVKNHRTYKAAVIFDGRFIPFRDKCFDIVQALEVIEHLEKGESDLLMKEAERVSVEKVVISTPLLGGRYWYDDEYHVSCWTPGEFRNRGYTVRGVGFSLFGRYTSPRLSYGLGPLAFYFPWLSYILLAWKNHTS